MRNASLVGAFVYGHTGEFGALARDLRIPGFALDIELTRSYRSSLSAQVGELGRGWTSNLARRVERAGDDVVYHDGTGRSHRFARARDGAFDPPPGLYSVLRELDGELVLEQRFGARSRFRSPEDGGVIVGVADRNGNELRFEHTDGAIEISDAADRRVKIAVEDGRWREVVDHTGRTWRFAYDGDARLTEVRRPATRDFPDGTTLRYAYDADHRIVALIDAKGHTYLSNRYDDRGRVVGQTHGDGEYAFEYDVEARRIRCRLTNGGLLEVEHDDAGHAVRSVLHVRSDALAADDAAATGDGVALVTECEYNPAGELIRRREPSGRETRWEYADKDPDPRNRGNLLEVARLPRPDVPHDPLVTRQSWARELQLVVEEVDALGRRTTFEYDARGNCVTTTPPRVTVQPVGEERGNAAPVERLQQIRREFDEQGRLTRETGIDETVTNFAYHERGARLLARVVRDADGVAAGNEFDYDDAGNCTEARDAKGQAVRLTYNAMGCVETAVSRAPFEYRVEFSYDENYNEIESARSFERFEIDRRSGKAEQRISTIREQRAYDMLRNVVRRSLVGDDSTVTETFVRDEAGRLARHVQPVGDVTEYVYDERDLVIEKRIAAGTPETSSERYTYSLDGSPRTLTAGDRVTTHLYDGFERYRGFRDPSGTTKRESLDEAGNVVAVSVGDGKWSALEAHYRVDEWNRVFRIDRLWHDPLTGKPQGETGWDGTRGMVSTVVEWGENGRPRAVWEESGNVLTFAYDGCTRITGVSDATGRSATIAYDENGNVVEVVFAGAEGAARRERYSYDAMDRLEACQVDDGPAERFRHNVFGAVAEYTTPSGLHVTHAHDALARHVGHAYAVGDKAIVRSWSYDENSRVAAYVDAVGNRAVYGYDSCDRQHRIVYPDGAAARVTYDAHGDPVQVVDANGAEIANQFDAVGRLVATTNRVGSQERFTYDGVGRLLSARARTIVQRTYDSLSRVGAEVDGRRAIRLSHDRAGNLTTIVYPGGDEIRRAYDERRRLTTLERNGIVTARFDYRDDDHVARVGYGDTLEATLTYDARRRLESIEYRNGDGAMVDGYRYGYDDAGRMTHEIHLARSDVYGERYVFDAAGRPVRADYGVADVFDGASALELRTTYDYFPEGRWRTRVDLDGSGKELSRSVGVLDARNRYRRFGKYTFTYDANGNCVRKESANPGFCLYTYDDANRLVKTECYDANAQLVQTIEYFYDALGRQTRKVVTNAAGVATETTYVWIGSLLAEEYEDGVLVRTYVHGIGSMPVSLVSKKRGDEFTYVLNGRGLVAGIVRNDDPNAFAEKYGYELTGAAFMTELGGVPVGLPERSTQVSGLDNPLVTGDAFGSVLQDWANGTLTGSGGGHLDTTISDAMNALGDVGAKGHHGVKSQMADQLKGMLGMLGYGGNASAPPSGGTAGGMTMNPDWKLYADGGDDGGDAEPTAPPLVSTNDDGTSTVHNADGSTSTGDPTGGSTSDPNEWQDPYAWKNTSGTGTSGSGGNSGGSSNFSSSPVGKVVGAVTSLATAYTNLPVYVGGTSGGGKEEGTPTYYGITINIKLPGSKMTDPDATDSTTVTPPPAGELEARLNRLKHPVNPNGDPGADPIDTSSPPPQAGGLDPTLILVDPDAAAGGSGATGTPKIDIAPIDHVPGWQPELDGPGNGPTVGMGGDTTGERWP